MRLYTGPPKSGKSFQVLEESAALLSGGRSDALILVPTTTHAGHLRHELARRLGMVRPACVQTLAQFIGERCAGQAPVSSAALRLLADQAIAASAPRVWRELSGLAGFHNVVARAIEELTNAGCDSLRLAALRGLGILRGPHTEALERVLEHMERRMQKLGLSLRPAMVAAAAAEVRRAGVKARVVFLDGFFSFSLAERDLLRALAKSAGLVVTLPEWSGAGALRTELLKLGLHERKFPSRPSAVRYRWLEVASFEAEVEEIARRIRALHAAGRPWRHMAVLLRTAQPYAPALRTAFARFGIPARFYLADALGAHPLARRLEGVAQSMIPLEAAPRTGESWVKQLQAAIAPAAGPVPVDPESRAAARGAATALRTLRECLSEAARVCGEDALSLETFWDSVRTLFALEPLRAEEAPADTVSILDVYEARQWSIPVAFVPGLLEGAFPLRIPPQPLLDEETRERLAANTVPVSTQAERLREEQFLFDLTLTRAEDEMFLSAPRFSAKGEAVLRSFALEGVAALSVPARRARPVPKRHVARPAAAAVQAPELLRELTSRHRAARPTALESFLQCPFQFFGRHTLRLKALDERPEERISPLTVGELAHRILNHWHAGAGEFEELLEREWAAWLMELAVPPGYRAEQARVYLRLAFEAYQREPGLRPQGRVATEVPLSGEVDGIAIVGRADRVDYGPENSVQVFDFKWTSAGGVARRVKKQEEGLALQGGLYLAVLGSQGYQPAGFAYVPLRAPAETKGWTGVDDLKAMQAAALDVARQALLQIQAGTVQPRPADGEQCDYCEYRVACRWRVAAAQAAPLAADTEP